MKRLFISFDKPIKWNENIFRMNENDLNMYFAMVITEKLMRPFVFILLFVKTNGTQVSCECLFSDLISPKTTTESNSLLCCDEE